MLSVDIFMILYSISTLYIALKWVTKAKRNVFAKFTARGLFDDVSTTRLTLTG